MKSPSSPSRSPLTEPVSPELVLVDPVLAAEARALLPERPWAELAAARQSAPTASAPPTPDARTPDVRQAVAASRPDPGLSDAVAELRRAWETAPAPAPKRRMRRLAVPTLGFAAVGAAVSALALGVVPSPEPDPVLVPTTSRQGTVRSALSPTDASAATDQDGPAEAAPAAGSEPLPGGGEPEAVQGAQQAPKPPPETPRTFVWPEAPRAAGYEFQLFRGSRLIFRTRTAEARLELPRTWKHAGSAQSLKRGSYRWYVWPIRQGSKQPAARALVQAELVVTANG